METVLNSSLAVGLYHTFLDWDSANQSDFSRPQQLHVFVRSHCIALLFAFAVCLLLLYWILVPINLVRDWSQSTQDDSPRSHPIPPVFPNGWVPIAESRDVTSTTILRAKVHVNQVIVVRKDDGKVAVYDAYCPHLGADLSVGGELVTSKSSVCIKCPFHGWMFSSNDGSCTRVPYAKDQRAPAGVSLKQWPSLERNGYVCVWYHAEGEEPYWFPPAIPEIDSGDWQYGGRTENIVNCHLQEIPENGADVGHLNAIHAPSMIWGSSFGSWTRSTIANFLLGAHEWSAEWRADGEDKHVARISIIQSFTMFGLTLISLDISVRQVGPSLVLLRFSCPQYNIDGVFSQAVMSVAANKQRVVHHIYAKQSIIGRLFSRLMLFGEANMIDRDCMMWQNKKFLKNPGLVREEKSIARFRHWFQQFYSIHSPKSFAPLLDW